jgi:SAM-dependent methyltransferase
LDKNREDWLNEVSKLNKYANPGLYWEERLSKNFDLTGVGHAGLGPAYNSRIYQARIDALKKAINALGITFSESNVLETGCGTGFFTEYCKEQHVRSYLGIVITQTSIRSLNERYPGYHFLQADIGDEDFMLGDQYDIILIADVLYHIVDDRRFATAIQHVSDFLKPGGFLIVSDVLTSFTIDTKEHCKWRSLSEYEALLIQNDLEIKQVEPIFSLLSPPVLLPHSSILWRLYAITWRYALLRLAHWRWFDNAASKFLGDLDKMYYLRHASIKTPNSKWLMAVKAHVG